MKNRAFVRVLFTYILINIIAVIIHIIVRRVLIDVVPRTTLALTETIITAILYLILSYVFLRNIAKRSLIGSIAIIFIIYIIPFLTGTFMMNSKYELLGMLIYFISTISNIGFYSFSAYLIKLPSFLKAIATGIMPVLLMYLGSKSFRITNK